MSASANLFSIFERKSASDEGVGCVDSALKFFSELLRARKGSAAVDQQAVVRQLLRKGALAPGYNTEEIVTSELFEKMMQIIDVSSLMPKGKTLIQICCDLRFEKIFERHATMEGNESNCAKFIAKDDARSVFEAACSAPDAPQLKNIPSESFANAWTRIKSARMPKSPLDEDLLARPKTPPPAPHPAQKANPNLLTFQELMALFSDLARTAKNTELLDIALAYEAGAAKRSGVMERVKNAFLEAERESAAPQTPTLRSRRNSAVRSTASSPPPDFNPPPLEPLTTALSSSSRDVNPTSDANNNSVNSLEDFSATAGSAATASFVVDGTEKTEEMKLQKHLNLKELQLKEVLAAMSKQKEETKRIQRDLDAEIERNNSQTKTIAQLKAALVKSQDDVEKAISANLSSTKTAHFTESQLEELQDALAQREEQVLSLSGDIAVSKKEVELKESRFVKFQAEVESIRDELRDAQFEVRNKDALIATLEGDLYGIKQSEAWFHNLQRTLSQLFEDAMKNRAGTEHGALETLSKRVRAEMAELHTEREGVAVDKRDMKLQGELLARKLVDLSNREATLKTQRQKFEDDLVLAEGTTLEERARRMALLQKVEKELFDREKLVIAAESTIIRGKAAKQRILELETALQMSTSDLKEARACIAASIDAQPVPTWSSIDEC